MWMFDSDVIPEYLSMVAVSIESRALFPVLKCCRNIKTIRNTKTIFYTKYPSILLLLFNPD